MCGIAGVVRLDGSPLDPADRIALRSMAAADAHRGPDDEQFAEDGPIGLAFRRLSIVDVMGGRQPLRNEDDTILLIANGEIYNHQSIRARLSSRHTFRTRSDCEAILHGYEEEGTDCLRGLVGMFALAIWDGVRQKLCLARDRFGIKPLFYTVNRGRVVFASEIKALLQHPECPRAVDWLAALQDPLLSGAVSTDLSDPILLFSRDRAPSRGVPVGSRRPQRCGRAPSILGASSSKRAPSTPARRQRGGCDAIVP